MALAKVNFAKKAIENYKYQHSDFMISNGKALHNLIDNHLKPLGYIKKKNTWYLHTEDCIIYFHCEKSIYGGGQYGDVIGCFLKEIREDDDEFPKYYKDNLRYSLNDMVNIDFVKNAYKLESQDLENDERQVIKDFVRKVFDLECRDFKNNERELILTRMITDYSIPFLNDIRTKEGIINAGKKYKGLKNRMDLKIKKALSIED